jgi:peptide/nickel transport system substrate-binding protein
MYERKQAGRGMQAWGAAVAVALSLVASANAAQPQYGGVLRAAFDGDPQCIDPQQPGNNTALNVGRQIADSLTDQRPDTGEIVPWLAQSWSVTDNNQVFTFVLREGATFSDGSPVDADAVRANLEGIVKLGARATLASTYLAGLKEITVADKHTVKIVFDRPNAQFLQATSTMSLGLLSKATLALTPEQRCQGQLAGSGPFVIDSFVHNQHVKLKRRDDYAWASALAGHAGKAYLEGIDFRVIPEAGVRNGSLLSRQIDVNTSVMPQDEAVLEAQKFPVLARGNPGVVYSLYPNESVAVAKDIAVR